MQRVFLYTKQAGRGGMVGAAGLEPATLSFEG